MSNSHQLPRIPSGIWNAMDYERLAPTVMEASHFAYVAGGCGEDRTVASNRSAFDAWQILPRLLCDVRHGHTHLQLQDMALPHPVLLAPVAHQRLAHADAEIATARAAQATNTCMVSSTLSSCTLEAIATASGPQRWFQLYFQPCRTDTADLLQRATQAGYRAIVVTLDAHIQLASRSALQSGFVMPPFCTPANLVHYTATSTTPLADGDSRIFQGSMRHAPTWDDLQWLLRESTLPVWVKGVLHPSDAQQLQNAGVAGLIVSNHGGRSLDGAPATLDMLPRVREAVGPAYPVLMDSGIRSGSDVFKALALGANAVLIGRLQVYALAVAGALGVAHMLNLLVEELHACMAQAGCSTLADIQPASLWPLSMPHHSTL